MLRSMSPGPVRLLPYDAAWPMLFEAEAARIERACRGLPIRLEHVGSTAIAGLVAKPIIDILAGRPARSKLEPYIAAFRQLGYEHKGSFGIPGREYFRRGDPRSHHVHLVEWASAFWREHLLFRDYLRANPAVALEYGSLKRHLAVTFANDHSGYTDGKGPFIRSIVRKARQDVTGE